MKYVLCGCLGEILVLTQALVDVSFRNLVLCYF